MSDDTAHARIESHTRTKTDVSYSTTLEIRSGSIPVMSAMDQLRRIKAFVNSQALSKDELLEKLNILSGILASMSEKSDPATFTPSMSRRPRFDTPGNRSRRKTRLQDPCKQGNAQILGSPKRPRYESPSDDDSDDHDGSFARLSFLLEKSIHEGQDALASPHTSHISDVQHRHAPELTSPIRSPLRRTSSARSRPYPRLNISNEVQSDHHTEVVVGSANSEDVSPISATDVPERLTSTFVPPPAYAEQRNDTAFRPLVTAPLSIVDDGFAALESLIDQLSANNLAGRAPSGLTSNSLLLVLSFFVLVIACLATNQFGQVGVNCHCTCPDLTTIT